MKKIITFALLLISLCFVTQGISQTDTTSTKNFDFIQWEEENPSVQEMIYCGTTDTTPVIIFDIKSFNTAEKSIERFQFGITLQDVFLVISLKVTTPEGKVIIESQKPNINTFTPVIIKDNTIEECIIRVQYTSGETFTQVMTK